MSDGVPPVRSTNTGRKEEHLSIVLNEDTSAGEISTGFENYQFIHQALPEMDLAKVDLSVNMFGKIMNAPIMISPMVGGIPGALPINQNLAEAAQLLGLAMGVGSERVALEDQSTVYTYQVRNIAPDILLFANLGAVQLNYGYDVAECQRAVDMLGADALILHLNPLQEALQPEGNTNFAGLLRKVEKICRQLDVPVVVKEVGWGISAEVAQKLASAGVAAIDVAGAGGTSWSKIEGWRAGNPVGKDVAEAFASWGIPTAESVRMVHDAVPDLPLIASGGIRTGVDAAKAIAMGADVVGIATPLLKKAKLSTQSVVSGLNEIIDELRIAMFCVGANALRELKDSKFLIKR